MSRDMTRDMTRKSSARTARRGPYSLSGLRSCLMFCAALPATIAAAAPVVIEVRGADGQPMPFAILSAPGKAHTATAPADAVVDQKGKRFEPFVSIVRPGDLVHFPNSDDIRHHVYSFSDAKRFELKLYQANDAPPVRFEQPGLVTLGCNIHDNMKAYVLVTDDSVAVVTDANGVAAVDGDLLAGEQPTLELWHPLGGEARHIPLSRAQQAGIQPVRVALPFSWDDPQASRSTAGLESLLRGFGSKNAQ